MGPDFFSAAEFFHRTGQKVLLRVGNTGPCGGACEDDEDKDEDVEDEGGAHGDCVCGGACEDDEDKEEDVEDEGGAAHAQ
jgi:hypothetical protein